MNTHTNVCIIGAGPAGATLSHFLSKKKIEHVLIDKATFPRDKVCGDGITVDVMNTLKRISPDLLAEFIAQTEMLPSWGFCFRAANGKELRYDFREDGFPYAPLFTSRRADLDQFLVERLHPEYCHFMPATTVTGLVKKDRGIEVEYEQKNIRSRLSATLVIGAEGEKPIVTRHLGLPHYRQKQHLIGALRVYYKNVKGFHSGNHLEFFLDKRLLPGYFWVFPLTQNEANVGLGMVSKSIAAKKFNLKKTLHDIVQTHPQIAEMFEEAEALEKPQGWGLPIVTSQRTIAGEHYALIGDAAGMIEPFTGKGIGPGMVSGRICADHIEEALRTGEYSLKAYQDHMYRYYKNEIRTGYTLQKSLRYPAVLNSFIGLANLGAIKRWSQDKMVTAWKGWM